MQSPVEDSVANVNRFYFFPSKKVVINSFRVPRVIFFATDTCIGLRRSIGSSSDPTRAGNGSYGRAGINDNIGVRTVVPISTKEVPSQVICRKCGEFARGNRRDGDVTRYDGKVLYTETKTPLGV